MRVNDRQTLLDIALQRYGAAEGAYALALLNDMSLSDELDVDQVLTPDGMSIANRRVVSYYDANGVMPATAVVEDNEHNIAQVAQMVVRVQEVAEVGACGDDEIIINDRQTLIDVALVATGLAEMAFALAMTNGMSLTDELGVGDRLSKLLTTSDEAVMRYYKANSIAPATAIEVVAMSDGSEVVLPTGINYMGIEIDFMVS